jgi:predicted naringenin-chalcone synthase
MIALYLTAKQSCLQPVHRKISTYTLELKPEIASSVTMKRSDSVASEMNDITLDDKGKKVFQSSKSRVVTLINWFDIFFHFVLPYFYYLLLGVVVVQIFRKLLEKDFDFYALYTHEFHFEKWEWSDFRDLGWRSMLLTAAFVYYLTHREKPVYLMDFTTFKPPESWNISPDQICEILERHTIKNTDEKAYTEESLAFQKRMIKQTGPGPSTAWPPGIVQVLEGKRYEDTIENSRNEAEIVMFDIVGRLLENTGVKAKEIDFLVVNCSLFSPTPSLASMIINKFGMRTDISSYNLSGMGCSAGLISVELAKNLLSSKPNSRCIIVSTEIITPNLYSGNDKGFLLQNLLFRCGGAAILLSNRFQDRFTANFKLLHVIRTQFVTKPKTTPIAVGDKVDVPNPSKPGQNIAGKVIAVATKADGSAESYTIEFDAKLQIPQNQHVFSADQVKHFTLDSFGCVYETEDPLGNRGVRLAKDLTTVAGRAMEQNFAAVGPYVLSIKEQIKYAWSAFSRNILKNKVPLYVPDFKSGIDHWCIHAGGRGVIDSVQANLNLADMDVMPSRMALNEFGNTSSSSIWYEMDYIRENFSNCKNRENLINLGFVEGHELKRSQKVFQIGFGSGFKCNSCVWLCINPKPKRFTDKYTTIRRRDDGNKKSK